MSEYLGEPFDEIISLPEVVSEIGVMGVIEKWREEPRAGDEGIAAFSDAAFIAYASLPEFKRSVAYMVNSQCNPDLGPGVLVTNEYLANLLYRSFQHVRMVMEEKVLMEKLLDLNIIDSIPQFKYCFPHEHDRPEAWHDTINNIFANRYSHDQFEYDIGHRWVQTNYYPRYRGVFLPIALDPDRPVGPINWADFGTSIGLGPRGLFSGEQLGQVTAYRPFEGQGYEGNGIQLEFDESTTTKFNEILKTRLPISICTGFDLTGVNDTSQGLWVKSSHYWRELKEKRLMAQFDRLLDVKDPDLNFYQTDLTDKKGFSETIEKNSIGKVDYVSILTMRHQLKSTSEYDQLISNAIEMLKPGGKIIEQEFLHTSIWPDWSYVTTVRNPFSSNSSPAVKCIWRNARCNEVIAEPIEANLN